MMPRSVACRPHGCFGEGLSAAAVTASSGLTFPEPALVLYRQSELAPGKEAFCFSGLKKAQKKGDGLQWSVLYPEETTAVLDYTPSECSCRGCD
ncbi:hypothetical protein NDU88_008628 [Pleurodeles waltl]|uniref:Uncharacterized protein n=1 Tax=Pleurodeles waltl TaxID=8319 RepID=A0AAV7N7R2_PLEWA|nr:hypothetical protein NDU88_008628 [Pleurodeles waltl]